MKTLIQTKVIFKDKFSLIQEIYSDNSKFYALVDEKGNSTVEHSSAELKEIYMQMLWEKEVEEFYMINSSVKDEAMKHASQIAIDCTQRIIDGIKKEFWKNQIKEWDKLNLNS